MISKTLPDWTEPHLKVKVESPSWFITAISHPIASHYVEVDDCLIHYLTWQQKSSPIKKAKPGLLLIHGGGAHANWWRFIAPSFLDEYQVAAIDLSGMGDSGAREEYTAEHRSKEISAVLKDANLGPAPIIIGHSFGGLMTMRFAAHYGEQIGGVIIVDSPVLPESEKSSAAPRRALSVSRYYPTFEIGLERFRLLPKQECQNQFIVEFIARHSLRETVSGWTWKFDVAAMGSRRWAEPFEEHLHNMKCRSALIVADNSAIVSSVTAQYMSDLMGPESPMTTIEDSHHHIMLDQPFRFIDAVKKILRNWDLR
ncbi:MAG: alpha/beta hydrolase [Proteobacteria bacterium]|mgnify:CR=1 FL=1|jgi:pimeloyl-ACP methyl ester carboxylesterase|nr:alpha/beta hydrolase [Pseudomonadota bacterium]